MRIPIQDRRTQSLRPVATPGQGQAPVAGTSLAGQALTEAAKLADQGQKIQSHFETIRLQGMLNEYAAQEEAEWSGTDERPGLQQTRGLAALNDEEGGYRSRLKKLESLRNDQLAKLPAHLRGKYELMLADRVRRTEGRFRSYALEEARRAGDAIAQASEKQVVDEAARVTYLTEEDKAAGRTTFDVVDKLVSPLDWLEDQNTGERTFGSSRSSLKLKGAPDELVEQHLKELRADAHLNSISSQITTARETKDIDLIDNARDHLEQAKKYLPQNVYDQAKKRIDQERVIVAAEGTYENLLTLAARESPDQDARWVDEATLSNFVNQIEDTTVRSAVRKLVREYKPLRDAAKKGVVDRYGSAALKTFWDTRSITAAENSEAMQWLERNDHEEWLRVKKEMETWASRWRREARANESLRLRRQSQAAQDPENIRLLWDLREDMLMNPDKYAGENYNNDSLMSEWGGKIPGGLHDQMYSSLNKHKQRMQKESYKQAQARFKRGVNARRDKFATAEERRRFVGLMNEYYDEWEAANPGKDPTSEDIDKIIGRADVEVFTGLWRSRTTAGEAAAKNRKIKAYTDPVTGERIEGTPPAYLFVEPELEDDTPTTAAQGPGAPPPDVDQAKWQRARAIMDPADRDDPEKVRRVMERL